MKKGRIESKHQPSRRRRADTSADDRVVDVQRTEDELDVTLMDGRSISVPLEWFPRLRNATPKQRRNWQLIGKGIGIHWPEVDEDISIEGLLRGAPAPIRAPRL